MDFSWSASQQELYNQAYEFARQYIAPPEESTLFKENFSRSQWALCAKFGLTGGCIAQEYGGKGWDVLTMAYVLEAFAFAGVDRGLLFSVAAHLFACVIPISRFGSNELKKMILPRLCDGSYIGANAITEDEAGSDAFSLASTAQLRDNYYYLNGEKNYVTNSTVADFILVYAKTDRNKGHWGISSFLVSTKNEGIELDAPFGKLGLNSAQAAKIRLTDCRVALEHRLGAEGEGRAIFNYSMQWERSCLFAIYLGMMELQLQQTIDFSKKRRQFGKRLSQQPLIADRITKMKLRLESARLLLYRACWKLAQGQDATIDISLSKLAVSQAAIQSGLDASHIHGALGIKTQIGIERMLRDSIPATLFSGTSEMMSYLVATELDL